MTVDCLLKYLVMQKIILYYQFADIRDPSLLMYWQRSLCEKLNLRGRIIISEQGINGTLGGNIVDLKKYINETKQYSPLKDTDFKWSNGLREDFPKLSIKVREEIVTFNAKPEIKLNERGIVGGGIKLKPSDLHKLLKEKADEVIFFDGRNMHESKIGRFKGAITPRVETTREFIDEIEKPEYEKIKNKTVVTYCTGGIRCEVLSVLMKNRGFKEVYQLDGGIVKYGEKFKDEGLWEGSLYVFDGRISVKFSDKAKDIAECIYCKSKTSHYINCANKQCNKLILVCEKCNKETYCNKDSKNATAIPT